MLKYIELKTGYHDNGPAWIARVRESKSGRTIYFDGRALKRGMVGGGNFFDIETREAFWVSGVKRDGTDRHWAGSGKIWVEAAAVEEYLAIVGLAELDRTRFTITHEIRETDPHTERLAAYWAEALGGPTTYSERYGDETSGPDS